MSDFDSDISYDWDLQRRNRSWPWNIFLMSFRKKHENSNRSYSPAVRCPDLNLPRPIEPSEIYSKIQFSEQIVSATLFEVFLFSFWFSIVIPSIISFCGVEISLSFHYPRLFMSPFIWSPGRKPSVLQPLERFGTRAAIQCLFLECSSPFRVFELHRVHGGPENKSRVILRNDSLWIASGAKYECIERSCMAHLSGASRKRGTTWEEGHEKARQFRTMKRTVVQRPLRSMRMEEGWDTIQRSLVEEIAEKLFFQTENTKILNLARNISKSTWTYRPCGKILSEQISDILRQVTLSHCCLWRSS